MLGFHPISSFPISDIKDTIVPMVIQRDSKIKTWTVPARSTAWNIPVCKTEMQVCKRPDTWTGPS